MQLTGSEHSMELKDVWLGYKPGEYLVTGINSSVRPGEMIALVGRNGTGKSTLLRTIAGIQSPARGEVAINGTSIKDVHPRELSFMISFVGTGGGLTENLTVYEMVSLGRHPIPTGGDHSGRPTGTRFRNPFILLVWRSSWMSGSTA